MNVTKDKNRKVFIFDLDKTLLDKNNIINKYTYKALSIENKKNNLLIAATGRSWQVVKTIKKINIFKYFVCNNGSDIFFKNKLIYRKNISSKFVIKILSILKKYKITAYIFNSISNKCYVLNSNHNIIKRLIASKISVKYKLDRVKNIKDKKNIIKIFIPRIINYKKNRILKNFYKDYSKYISEYTYYFGTIICPKKTSKGHALKIILKKFPKLNVKNIYAFGDSINDISMKKVTPNLIIRSNSSKKVKAYATDFFSTKKTRILDYLNIINHNIENKLRK